jgi:hypothetical protein
MSKVLKKYGVSVIPELVNKSDKDVQKSNIDDGAELPSILFMAINDGESASDKKKFMQPDFFLQSSRRSVRGLWPNKLV